MRDPASDVDLRQFEYAVLRGMKYARLRWADEPEPRTVAEEPQPVQLTLSVGFLENPQEARSARLAEIVFRSFGQEVVAGYVEEDVDFSAAVVGAHLLFGGDKVDVYRSGRCVELEWIPGRCVRDHTLAVGNAVAFRKAYENEMNRGRIPPLRIKEFSRAIVNAGARTKSIHIGGRRLDVELRTLFDEDNRVVSRRKTPLAVLERLAATPGKWVSTRELVKSVWGDNYDVVDGPYDDPRPPINCSRRLEQAVHEVRTLLRPDEADASSSVREDLIDNERSGSGRVVGAYRLALDDMLREPAAERQTPLAAEVLNGRSAMGTPTPVTDDSRGILLPRGFTTAAEQPEEMLTVVGERIGDQAHDHGCIAAWHSYGDIRRMMRDVDKDDQIILPSLIPERPLRDSYGERLILHEIVVLAEFKDEQESWVATVGFCADVHADDPDMLWDMLLLSRCVDWRRGDVVLGFPSAREFHGEMRMDLEFFGNRMDGSVLRSGRKLSVTVFDPVDLFGHEGGEYVRRGGRPQ